MSTNEPPQRGVRRLLVPLRHRDFRLLWIGTTASLYGNALYFVAIAWLVYDLSDSAMSMSLVGTAVTLPYVLLLLLGGVAGDRYDRRHVLVASDLVRGVAITAVGILAVADLATVAHIVAIMAVYGVGEGFFGPSYGAILPRVLPQELLEQGNAVNQATRSSSQLAGPVLGGVLVAWIGPGWVLVIDGVTFVASILAVLAMAPQPRAARHAHRRSSVAEIADGFRFARGQQWLRSGLGASFVGYTTFFGPAVVLAPLVVRNDMQGGADTLGLVYAAGGLGAIVTAVLLGRRGRARRPVRTVALGWCVSCAGIALFPVGSNPIVAGATVLVTYAGVTAAQITWTSALQRDVPDELLGRVSSFSWFVSTSMIPASYMLAGPASSLTSPSGAMTLMGLAGVLALAVLAPRLRRVATPSEAGR